MTRRVGRRRFPRAAAGVAWFGACLLLFPWAVAPALARPAGDVIAEFSDVSATFSGGDPEFTVMYDVVVIEEPDGTITAVFEQQRSPDVVFGPVNAQGVPPKLVNPGKEKLTGGRMKDGRTLVFGHYEYVSGGQTYTWSKVVFNFPAGALPFPAPEDEDPSPTPAPAEEEEDEEPETAVSQPTSENEGGFPTGLALGLAAGAAVIAGGTRLLTQSRTRAKRGCEEEYAAWQAAEAAYDQAVAAEIKARHAMEDQGFALSGAQVDRSTAYTKATGKHMDETGGVKEMGDWEGRAEYDARIEQEQAKLDAAQAALDAATARRKELDAQREAAKKAYEECVGAAAAAAAAAPGTATATGSPGTATATGAPGTATATAGGTSIATAPAPYGSTRTRGCPEGTTRNRTSTKTSVDVVIDFRVRAIPTGTRFGRYQDADELAVSLQEIAEILGDLEEGKLPGKAGELQDLKDKAKSLADKAKTVAGEGVGGLVKQEIEGAIQEQVNNVNSAAKDALNDATGIGDAIDAATKVPDLLKEPYKIPLEILKFTAELGADVALFAGRVVDANDMYTVATSVQTLQVDILWMSYEKCVNNRWKKVHEIVTANGPTKWSGWRSHGEFPGSAYGRDLDRGMKRALQWCQTQLNTSNQKLSDAINNPPKGR